MSYASRTNGVTVNLATTGNDDGSQDDGNPGARDSVGADVEQVIGSNGPDVLNAAGLNAPATIYGLEGADNIIGGNAPNTLFGQGGIDTITGGPDQDRVDGGDAADTLNALGAADQIFGGAGYDSIEARDGSPDTVNCGADYASAATDPADSRVSCEPTILKLGSPVMAFKAGKRSTVFRKLIVTSVPSGSKLTAQCRTKKAKKCKRVKDFSKDPASGNVRLVGFQKKAIPVGAKITIEASKPGATPAVQVLKIRKKKSPSVTGG